MTKKDKTLIKYRLSQGTLKISLLNMDKHHYHMELIEHGNNHYNDHKYQDAQYEYLAAIYGYISDSDDNVPRDDVYLLSFIDEWINRIKRYF